MEKDKKRPTPHELAQRIILRNRERLKKLGLITRREDMPEEILNQTDDDDEPDSPT